MEFVHSTNQLVPLPSQPLECLGIYKRLGSGIGRFLAGRSKLVCQLHRPLHLFGTSIPAAIHEELQRRNMSEVPRRGARVKGADMPYLAAWDDDIPQRTQ
jgi:hypothetical protein